MIIRETLPATDKTISHTIALGVMDNVRELLHFTNAVDLVYDNSDFKNEKYLLKYKKDNEIRANKIDVYYEESPSEDPLYFMPAYNTNKPFIQDRDLTVKPVYIQYKMELNFKVISKSRTVINEIADRLYRVAMEGFRLTHHSKYIYYLNNTISYLILFIHKYRTNYNLINMELLEFLSSISDNGLELTYDNSGRPVNVTYSTTINNINGIFKDIREPKIEFNKETGYYTIDFSYEIEYSKLMYVDIFYNYVIANQFLPKALIPEDTSYEKDSPGTMISEMSRFNISESLFNRVINNIMANKYIRLPENDVDSNVERHPFINTILCGLTLLSPSDSKSLIDLKNLGDIQFTDDVLEFIRGEGNAIVNEGESIIQVMLFKDNRLSGIPLEINDDLIVSAVDDLDLNAIYRIGIGLVTDIGFLKRPAYERYKAFRVDVMKKLINSDRPNIVYEEGHLMILDSFFIYDIYSECIFKNTPIMKTVLTSHILAMLKDK